MKNIQPTEENFNDDEQLKEMSPQEMADLLLNKVRLLCKEQQPEQALEVVDRAIKYAPDPVQAWLIKGEILAGLQLYDEALEATESALKVRDDRDVLKLRGNIFTSSGKFENALDTFTELISIDPENPEGYFLRASIFAELENFNRALNDLETATGIDPDMGFAWFNQGLVYLSIQRYGAAIKAFEKTMELLEDFIEPIYYKGIAHRKLAQTETAMECFQIAADMWQVKGLFKGSQEAFSNALDAIEQGLDIDVTNTQLWQMRGKLLYKTGHKKEGLEVLRSTAQISLQGDDLKSAFKTLDIILELEPEDKDANKEKQRVESLMDKH